MGVQIRQEEDRIIYRTVIKRKKRGGWGKGQVEREARTKAKWALR